MQDEKPADYYDLFVLAEEAAAALKAERGTEYLIGTAPELIYPTTGSSDDWAKGVAGAKYAYTVELPDTGTHGFVLPADNIRPVGIETWAGIRTMARRLAQSV
ncbi:carboxypeptidase B-like [Schistocerca americana]|uniref:carboxypeptidase B-like n=1 Tax=Schistocerca americana TaxID=7009 RepID=UPI001F4F2F38|nr:carboxypeptidase B-like [Schistocerca americana]